MIFNELIRAKEIYTKEETERQKDSQMKFFLINFANGNKREKAEKQQSKYTSSRQGSATKSPMFEYIDLGVK